MLLPEFFKKQHMTFLWDLHSDIEKKWIAIYKLSIILKSYLSYKLDFFQAVTVLE